MTSKTLAPSKPVEKNQTPDRHGTAEADGVLSQVVSFRLAKEEYGLDIMRSQEIILMGDITQIPEVPDYICGLINLRGKVIPIVDLRKRFCLEAGEATEHTRIMVVNTRTTTFGIVVDAVSQVLRIEANQIEPPPGLVGQAQPSSSKSWWERSSSKPFAKISSWNPPYLPPCQRGEKGGCRELGNPNRPKAMGSPAWVHA